MKVYKEVKNNYGSDMLVMLIPSMYEIHGYDMRKEEHPSIHKYIKN